MSDSDNLCEFCFNWHRVEGERVGACTLYSPRLSDDRLRAYFTATSCGSTCDRFDPVIDEESRHLLSNGVDK